MVVLMPAYSGCVLKGYVPVGRKFSFGQTCG